MSEYIKNAELKTPYYMFYADEFAENYKKLEKAFQSIYPKYQIAYSFKTNYMPAVCEMVRRLGGYAEVVSDMEYMLAKKTGFVDEHIIYNGPGKGKFFETCILNRGLLNVDNMSEVDRVCRIADLNKKVEIKVGIRVNFDIGNAIHSRFGLDSENGDFQKALSKLRRKNVHVQGVHFHISQARELEFWKKRIEKLLAIVSRHFQNGLSYIDIGSGMFGQMDEELQKQFNNVPTYDEYAGVVAKAMTDYYNDIPENERPVLITEPGATLISKYVHLFSSVLDIKEIRGRKFALLDCSIHNAGEICRLKKVPVRVIGVNGKEAQKYDAIDFVGYTCLEQDCLYKNYAGRLAVGDLVEFSNVGGYSVVLKPPFIHADIPAYMLQSDNVTCIKRAQTFEDVFAPYYFWGKGE